MGRGANNELLFSSGVLTAADGGVSLSAAFESTIDDYRATIAGHSRSELYGLIEKLVGEGPVVEPLVELVELDPRVGAELCALADHVEASTNEWLPLLPVLQLFRDETVPTGGTPDGFVPVPAAYLPHLSRIYSPLLAYVWLDDCEPCDALRGRLESIFERPRELLTVAVYGPAHRDVLVREYDVTAGPALLFMRDGAVDARLYGDHDEAVIETELDRLRR